MDMVFSFDIVYFFFNEEGFSSLSKIRRTLLYNDKNTIKINNNLL